MLPLRSLLGGLSNDAKNERAEGLERWINSVIDQSAAGTDVDLAYGEIRDALRRFFSPLKGFLSE